jgi:hypothetical protein
MIIETIQSNKTLIQFSNTLMPIFRFINRKKQLAKTLSDLFHKKAKQEKILDNTN